MAGPAGAAQRKDARYAKRKRVADADLGYRHVGVRGFGVGRRQMVLIGNSEVTPADYLQSIRVKCTPLDQSFETIFA